MATITCDVAPDPVQSELERIQSRISEVVNVLSDGGVTHISAVGTEVAPDTATTLGTTANPSTTDTLSRRSRILRDLKGLRHLFHRKNSSTKSDPDHGAFLDPVIQEGPQLPSWEDLMDSIAATSSPDTDRRHLATPVRDLRRSSCPPTLGANWPNADTESHGPRPTASYSTDLVSFRDLDRPPPPHRVPVLSAEFARQMLCDGEEDYEIQISIALVRRIPGAEASSGRPGSGEKKEFVEKVKRKWKSFVSRR